MGFSASLTGIALGIVFGFVLQRGRFCLNTAFRNILYINDFTIFRAYLLAVIVATVGSQVLEQLGLVHLGQARQEFAWLANILGGYLFGVGMVLAGGSASGTWYRVGEGLVGSWMAVLGFMGGAAAMKGGLLSGLYAYLRTIVPDPGTALTVHSVLGVNRWILIALITVAGLVYLIRGTETYKPTGKEFHWRTTGILIGAVVILGWYLSNLMTGNATGVTLTDPSGTLLMSFLGEERWNWNIAVVVGIPIGSYISAKSVHDFSWRSPRADVMVKQFFGGLIMGAGGMLAGGCSVGHGLTGLSALSLASLVTTISIVLGCWTMVYALFMRNPVMK